MTIGRPDHEWTTDCGVRLLWRASGGTEHDHHAVSVCRGHVFFWLVIGWRPQQDSNLRTRLRRPLLYPLSYGGWRDSPAGTDLQGRSQGTSSNYHRTRHRSARILAAEPIASRGGRRDWAGGSLSMMTKSSGS